MGESYLGPYHRGMYKRDRLGNKYPVDKWGVRAFFNRDPDKLYRPEEVTENRWKKASIKMRTEWAAMFPPRRQGVHPDGEPERVIRDREMAIKRTAKRKKAIAKAAVATVGLPFFAVPSANDSDCCLSSDGGATVCGSASDNDARSVALRRKIKFAQRRRGRREVIRKGLDISKMKSSCTNDVGPSLSFPPVTSLTDDEGTTAGETDGEVTCSGDEDWIASEEVVSATQWIEQSIAEEADVHHSRPNRTPWSLDRLSLIHI